MSNRELARLHCETEQRAARMQAQCEDAVACTRVFDETVANLVEAKMAHATADAALRAMRDQVEALSAQVPLSAGQSTHRSGDAGGGSREGLLASMWAWGRRSRGSGDLQAPEELPARQEGRSTQQERLLPSAVSRCVALPGADLTAAAVCLCAAVAVALPGTCMTSSAASAWLGFVTSVSLVPSWPATGLSIDSINVPVRMAPALRELSTLRTFLTCGTLNTL